MDLGSRRRRRRIASDDRCPRSACADRVEEQAGTTLFRKSGRGLALTEAGELMLRILPTASVELNDEAAVAMRGVDLEGWIRLGFAGDFMKPCLPEVLGRFARAHPESAHRGGAQCRTVERVETNQLDLALVWGGLTASGLVEALGQAAGRTDRGTADVLDRLRRACRGPGDDDSEPLPLVAFDRQCLFHSRRDGRARPGGDQMAVVGFSPSLGGQGRGGGRPRGRRCAHATACSTVRAPDPRERLRWSLPTIPLTLQRASATAPASIERLAATCWTRCAASRRRGKVAAYQKRRIQ